MLVASRCLTEVACRSSTCSLASTPDSGSASEGSAENPPPRSRAEVQPSGSSSSNEDRPAAREEPSLPRSSVPPVQKQRRGLKHAFSPPLQSPTGSYTSAVDASLTRDGSEDVVPRASSERQMSIVLEDAVAPGRRSLSASDMRSKTRRDKV